MQAGDHCFEAPGYIALVRNNGVIYWADKPHGTAEKAYPFSHSLQRLDGMTWDNRDEKGGDPPCPTCGKWFASWAAVERHEQHHHRRGIGAPARAKRLKLKQILEGKPERLRPQTTT